MVAQVNEFGVTKPNNNPNAPQQNNSNPYVPTINKSQELDINAILGIKK